MRQLIPYRTLRFVVASPPDVVASTLKTRISNPQGFFPRRTPEPFRGRIGAHDFVIWRQIHNRNSFLPVIIGSLRPAGSGCEVNVVMRLHYVVAAFMVFWCCGVLTALLGVVTHAERHPLMFALPLMMLVFGLLLLTLPFKIEADRAERLLSDLFARL